jgi:uncharacterized phage protein gp47/JayE
MAGLTAAGYERKTLATIISELEADLRVRLGNDLDTRPESVVGQIIGVVAAREATIWELGENTYHSQSPQFAEGVQLDEVASVNGITRLPATRTTVTGILYGLQGSVVPAGSQAQNTVTGDVYSLLSSVTITSSHAAQVRLQVSSVQNDALYQVDLSGEEFGITSAMSGATAFTIADALRAEINGSSYPYTASIVNDNELLITADTINDKFNFTVTSNLTVAEFGSFGNFEAVNAGALFLPVSALNGITTPVFGWQRVSNIFQGITGRNRENDVEFRERRRLSVSLAGSGNIDAIKANLLQIPEVRDVQVYVNDGETTDSNGIPPQHTYSIVRGGSEQEIAEVLFLKGGLGIGKVGSVEVPVTGLFGQQYIQKFDRPTEVPLFIDIEITPNGTFPVDGEEKIKQALLAYIDTLGIGATLLFSRLYTPINSVQGFFIDNLAADITATPTATDNITLAINEIFSLDPDDITITVN